MEAVFETLLRMSLTGSMVIAVVLLARLALKKAPKKFSYALWAVVLFRLVCPVSFTMSMPFGVRVDTAQVTQYLHSAAAEYEMVTAQPVAPQTHAEAAAAVSSKTGAASGATQNPAAQPDVDAQEASPPQASALPQPTAPESRVPLITAGAYLWLAGVAAMTGYSAVSLVRLKRRLRTARPLRENLYLADVQTPFVLGMLRPKIYLPAGLGEQETAYIVLHEQHHIRRGDHIVKLLAFAALALHWFNPLVWLAFSLAGRDMEMSCDEAVMKHTGGAIRADYAQSLLNLSAGHRRFAATPLAFGEGAPKARIKNVLRWKKPAAIGVAVAAVAVIVLTVVLAANQKPSPELAGSRFAVEDCVYQSPYLSMYYTPEGMPGYMVTKDLQLLSGGGPAAEPVGEDTAEYGAVPGWNAVGVLRETAYTNDALNGLFASGEAYDVFSSEAKRLIDGVTDVWRVDGEDGQFYLVMQTEQDETLLANCYESGGSASATWLCLLTRSGDAFDLEALQTDACEMSGDEKLQLFSFYEAGDMLLAGFESGSHMGFATFRKKAGGYQIRGCQDFGGAALYSMTIMQEQDLDHSVTVALSRRQDLAVATARAGAQYQEQSVTSCPAMIVFEWPEILPEDASADVRFYNAANQELSRDALSIERQMDAIEACVREWAAPFDVSLMSPHVLDTVPEMYTVGYSSELEQELELGVAVVRRNEDGTYEVVAGQSLFGASLYSVQLDEVEGLDHSVTVALIGRDDVAMVEARAGEQYQSQQMVSKNSDPMTYDCPTALTFEWDEKLPAGEIATVTFYDSAGEALTGGQSATQEELDFLDQFPQLDGLSLHAYLQAYPEALENGWENLYLNEAGFDDEGTGIYTTQGDEVLAIDAKNGILLLRVEDEGYRGVLAIANDPAKLSVEMSAGIGEYGELIGDIAEAHNGVLAMSANGFLDTDAEGNSGNGNGGQIAGYAMSGGTGYGEHFGAGYYRLELHENNRFYIVGADEPVSATCTDAVEFQPVLVKDGALPIDENWTAENPRACIGQTYSGEILMLVIEGRIAEEGVRGTDVNTCAKILARYGCKQALNVDGGTSAMLWYDGEYVIRCSNSNLRYTGGRAVPNAFVIQKSE